LQAIRDKKPGLTGNRDVDIPAPVGSALKLASDLVVQEGQ
jgi:hypothetical protein